MTVEYILGKNKVIIDGDLVTTILPTGQRVIAYPEDNPEYRAMAEKLGYGEDTARMNREHDLIHTIICVGVGLGFSPGLMDKANGVPLNDVTGAEEDAVLAVQRFLNLVATAYPTTDASAEEPPWKGLRAVGDGIKDTWAAGQKWETRMLDLGPDSPWVAVGDGGYAEPLWDRQQEYRRVE